MGPKIEILAKKHHESEDDRLTSHPSLYREDEIDLVELLAVLWRRKMLLAAVAAAVTLLAVAYVLLATPKYKITAQLSPGITGYDDKGQPVRDWSATDIVSWFKAENYLPALAGGSIDPEELPEITASSSRDSHFVTVELFWPDQKQGAESLSAVFSFIQEGGSKEAGHLSVTRKGLEQHIFSLEKDKERLLLEKVRIGESIERHKNELLLFEKEIAALRKNLDQDRLVSRSIGKQIDVVNKNTEELMTQRSNSMSGTMDGVAMLMYSNVTQQNIAYVTNLEQRQASLAKDINNYAVEDIRKNNAVKSKQIAITELQDKLTKEIPLQEKRLDHQILTTRNKLASLRMIEVVQAPFSSMKPEKPQKRKLVALALVFGLFLGVASAYAAEFYQQNKAKLV